MADHADVPDLPGAELDGQQKVLLFDPNYDIGSRSKQTALAGVQRFLHRGPNLSVSNTGQDPRFIVLAACIPYPTSTNVHGQPITWDLYTPSSSHGYGFFQTAVGQVTERLRITFPPVKNVMYSGVTPDETFAPQLLVCGPTTATSYMEIAAYVPYSQGVTLTGNGSGGWTQSPSGVLSLGTYSGGQTAFNFVSGNGDYDAVGISYIGPNRYTINRAYSGLGMYNAAFILIDAAGSPLSTNPTTSDRVTFSNVGIIGKLVPLATYSAGSNSWLSGFVNFWVTGMYECWMVVQKTGSTTATVFWQAYPSATSYKIYRDTNSDFSTQTLIYSGTDMAYDDSSLTPGTLYYYKMVAVISGVDTTITNWTHKA